MRKLVGVALLIATAIGSGTSLAGPGPNGHNNWGLCNAYAHNGGGNSHNAPPFAALEQAAEDADQTVAEWCAENGQHPGNNP